MKFFKNGYQMPETLEEANSMVNEGALVRRGVVMTTLGYIENVAAGVNYDFSLRDEEDNIYYFARA